jgi:replicative DNA helicase
MSNDRLPPYDGEAEKAVLGSILIDGDALFKIVTSLDAGDFFILQNQEIYAACRSLNDRNETINQITVAQELAQKGKLEEIGGVSYLSQLVATVPTSLHIESYAQIVSRLSIMRRLISASDRIAAIGYEAEADVDDALAKAENILFKVKMQERGDFDPLRNILRNFFEQDTEALVGSRIPFINTGFFVLDNLLIGLQRSALVVLGARTSIGKTSLALNIARNAAVDQRACVALFSLEMSKQELIQRLLSNESEISTKLVRSHQYKDDKKLEKKVMDASGDLSEAKIFIDDTSQVRVSEMKNKVFRLNLEHPVDLVIVDYLQLIRGDIKTENRYQELSQITRSLKALARDLNVPVLALSQLRRPEHQGPPPRPRLSDLRDSGSIEQDADVVIFMHREDNQSADGVFLPDEKEDITRDIARNIASDRHKELTEVIVAKNRSGPIGEGHLVFNSEYTKFTDYTGPALHAVQSKFQ